MTKPQIEIYESILKSAKQNYLLKEKMNVLIQFVIIAFF